MGNVSRGCARWGMLHVNYEEKAHFRLKYIRADGKFLTKTPLRFKPNEVKVRVCFCFQLVGECMLLIAPWFDIGVPLGDFSEHKKSFHKAA